MMVDVSRAEKSPQVSYRSKEVEPMLPNTDKSPESWSDYHVRSCTTQLRALHDALLTRILPSFNSVQQEGCEREERELARLERTWDEHEFLDYDPLKAAEMALEVKYNYFELMSNLQQSLINSTAVCMNHLFEQQLLQFLQREFGSKITEISNGFRGVCETEMKKAGIDVATLPGWADADILRLVANTVKHSNGPSATELRGKRPDFFQATPSTDQPVGMRLQYPAFGDFFVKVENIELWKNSLISFWTKISERCRERSRELVSSARELTGSDLGDL